MHLTRQVLGQTFPNGIFCVDFAIEPDSANLQSTGKFAKLVGLQDRTLFGVHTVIQHTKITVKVLYEDRGKDDLLSSS